MAKSQLGLASNFNSAHSKVRNSLNRNDVTDEDEDDSLVVPHVVYGKHLGAKHETGRFDI
jgi:hypothetical protein